MSILCLWKTLLCKVQLEGVKIRAAEPLSLNRNNNIIIIIIINIHLVVIAIMDPISP